MKKRRKLMAMLLLLCLCALPAKAALTIEPAWVENNGNRVVSMIMAGMEQTDAATDEAMQVQMNANMRIQSRFPIGQYLMAMNRAGASQESVNQTLRLYQDGQFASIAVLWQGEQADGTHGSSVQTLSLDLETGEEIVFDDLFIHPLDAAAEMEAIIAEQIEQGLSDYMEYADLLPMPLDNFSYDENGLTVYYPQERYLYFSGRSGAVHFAWHEIDHLIAQDSPVFAISREQPTDAQMIAEQIRMGKLPGALEFGLGDRLGDALDALALLSDPDYTRESLVYLLEDEALRGFALEIPRYAETEEDDTPVSAVRSSRTQLFGLVTGETTKTMAAALLGKAEQTRVYDREDAADWLLVAGESWLYSLGGHVLQLHFDEENVLHTIILRNEMP